MPKEYDKRLDDGQQLDIYDGPAPQEPAPNFADDATYEEKRFFSDMDAFVNNCTSLDSFDQLSSIIRGRLRDVPGAQDIRNKLMNYGSEMRSIASSINSDSSRKGTSSRGRVGADHSARLPEAREKFRPLMQELRTVMHQNWDHPKVQRAVQSSQHILNNYAQREPIINNGWSPREEQKDFFKATDGEKINERQRAINNIHEYMESVQWGQFDKHISLVNNAQSKEEYYKKSYDSLAKSIVSGYSTEIQKLVPRYNPETHGAYGTAEGIKNYCRDMDTFFKSCTLMGLADGKNNIIENATKRARSGKKLVDKFHDMNKSLDEMSGIISDTRYSEKARTMLASSFAEKLKEEGQFSQIPTPEEAGGIDKWFKRFTSYVGRMRDFPDALSSMQKSLNSFSRNAQHDLEAKEKEIAFTRQVEALQQRTDLLKGTMKRSYSTEFQNFVNSLDTMLEEPNGKGMAKTSNRERTAEYAAEYCIRKARQNKSSYDSMEAARLGSVIETLKEMDPERGRLMEDVFGMSVSMEGDKKNYSFRQIPASLLKTNAREPVSLTSLERNIAAYRSIMETAPDIGRISAVSSGMLKSVKDADPALMSSSAQYRAFRKASQTLADELNVMNKAIDKGEKLSSEKKQDIFRKIKAVRDTANAYRTYKQNTKITKIGQKRIDTSIKAIREADMMEDLLRVPDMKNAYKADPQNAISQEMDYMKQNRDATPDNLAKMIALTQAGFAIENGESPDKFRSVMTDPQKLRNQTDKIKNSPEFKDMLKAHPEITSNKALKDVDMNKAIESYVKAGFDRKQAEKQKAAGRNPEQPQKNKQQEKTL